METPCKDCQDRYVSCHSSCDQYKQWKADLSSEKEKIRKVRYAEIEADRRRRDGIANMRRIKK